MKQLGLKIEYSFEGLNELLSINATDKWSKYTGEISEIKNIKRPKGEDWTAIFLYHTNIGCILRVACSNSGRNDYMVASIYIPKDVIIPGKKLSDLLTKITKELFAGAKNKDLFQTLFSQEYECDTTVQNVNLVQGDKFGFRFYGGYYELYEILDNLYQVYYKDYKCICLIKENSNLTCEKGEDLTKKELSPLFKIPSPEHKDGFVPYINGKVFDSPMYVSKGEIIEITWKKNDYEPIRIRTEVNEGFTYIEPTENQYRRLIPYEAVRVVDEWKQPIEEYKLSINQHAVNTGETIPVSEAALNNVRIDIYADGYDSKEEIVDFTKDKTKIIQLSKVTYEYKLAIPLDNKDSFIELEPIITHKELKKSPIKGYKPKKGRFIQKKITYLKYYPYNKFFWIQVAVVLSVVLILGVALGAWGWNKYKTEELRIENSSLKSDIEQLKSKGGYNYDSENTEENTIEQENDVAKVIEYLDNNNVWNREKMEGFSQIKGLWDAINTHDFGKILELENTLKDSKRFKNLISAIRDNKNKKFTTNYNKDNDFDITIETEKDKTGNVKNKGYIKALYDAGGNSSRSKGVSNNASHHSGSGDNNNNQDNWK